MEKTFPCLSGHGISPGTNKHRMIMSVECVSPPRLQPPSHPTRGGTQMLSNHGWLSLPEPNGMDDGVFDSWFEIRANTTIVKARLEFSHVLQYNLKIVEVELR